MKVRWLREPKKDNYPAAHSYLSLLCGERKAAEYVKRLRRARLTKFKATDILRASALSPTPTDPRLKREKKKIRAGEKLSPLLLIRDTLKLNCKLVIADGYHRLCAVYEIDEEADIPCKII